MIIAFLVAGFFAMNIGASGAAASMGVAYGSGAIRRRWVALSICAVAIVLGSVFGGQKVAKTISSGIIPEHVFTVQVAVLALLAATLSLFIANILGIPLSTSEITIGAVAGVGIAYHVLYVQKLLFIVMFWFITPVVAFTLTYFIGKAIHALNSKYPYLEKGKWKPLFTFLVILTGFFEAYSAGMKNVANAVAPLVGAHLLPLNQGLLLGGLAVAVGAMLLGSRVLETNGKKITSVSLLEGIAVSATSSALVISAALFGIPLPIAQITTSSIVGIGSAQKGRDVFRSGIVSQMLKVWFIAPFLSLLLSYTFVKVLLESDGYAVFIIGAGVVATAGIISLLKDTKQKKQVGGIS